MHYFVFPVHDEETTTTTTTQTPIVAPPGESRGFRRTYFYNSIFLVTIKSLLPLNIISLCEMHKVDNK